MTRFCNLSKNALIATTIAVAFAAGASAQAATTKNKQPEAQKTSDHQLGEAIHLLNSVKKTLEAADHDYGGHRADAVRDVGQAVKQLHEALAAHHKMSKTGTTKTGSGNNKKAHPEPQKLSDAELAGAIPILQATVTFLQNADHDYGGHKEKAIKDLNGAITQLGKALKFSKANDQNKP
jgi:hypothetical protein